MIMDKNRVSGAISKIKLEKIAEERAKELGYHQSDKTQFDTTPWCEHNIFVRGWKEGYNYHKQESEGLREEWIDCNEALPNPDAYERVLTWNEINGVQVRPTNIVNKVVRFSTTCDFWMPLPSPPHLSKENDER